MPRPAGTPELTASQRSFLQASEQEEGLRRDEERQQIERMRTAQEEREKAFAGDGQRSGRPGAGATPGGQAHSKIGIAVTGVLSVAVGGAGLIAYRNGEKARLALNQIQEERNLQDRLIRLARNRDYPPRPTTSRRWRVATKARARSTWVSDFTGHVYYGTSASRPTRRWKIFWDSSPLVA
jgi:hypothetical protein